MDHWSIFLKNLKGMSSSNWQFVFFRYFASFLFILSHSLLVLDHLPVGAALHGLGEVFIAPWAFKERAWDLVVIAVLFLFFDIWGLINTPWNWYYLFTNSWKMISIMKSYSYQIYKIFFLLLLTDISNLYAHNLFNGGCKEHCGQKVKVIIKKKI